MEDLREELIGACDFPGFFVRRLTSIYGNRAREIAALAASEPSLARPLAEGGSTIGAEFVWSIEHEMAIGLSDAIIRRTMSAWTADLGRSAAEGAARVGQSHLGWTNDRAADELAEFDDYIERFRSSSK